MNISIFGLGYVGCVSAGCLADFGHHIIGVDIDHGKVNLISKGRAPIEEFGLDALIQNGVLKNMILATHDASFAILESQVSIVCVGTPSGSNGCLDMTHIFAVAKQIAEVLRIKNDFLTIAIRSTVIPGTIRKISELISEISRKKIGEDFAVVSNPEFLREGTAVNDFINPPYTVLASDSQKGISIMKKVYRKTNAEIITVDVGISEMIKFASNSFHALKIAFANEVGRTCKELGVDSQKLMELFVRDTSLNIAPSYLKPGFCYGGSCLPKDLMALSAIAHKYNIVVPVISAISVSNQMHLERVIDTILKYPAKSIGIYGLAFKSGTDDLRFSPALELVERLLKEGKGLKVYDKLINLSRLFGKNREFLYFHLPHIDEILVAQLSEFVFDLELLVMVNPDENVTDVVDAIGHRVPVLDLAGVDFMKPMPLYSGICW